MLGRAPQTLPLVGTVTIDGRTLALTAIVALITGIVFGILPAMQVGKHDLATALRAGVAARGRVHRPIARSGRSLSRKSRLP